MQEAVTDYKVAALPLLPGAAEPNQLPVIKKDGLITWFSSSSETFSDPILVSEVSF